MEVRVYKSDETSSEVQRLVHASFWLADQLLDPVRADRMNVALHFRKMPDAWGYCNQPSINERRIFEIALNSEATEPRQLITLCHEFVHLKQMAYGELEGRFSFIDGKVRVFWKGGDITGVPYLDRPDELEARKMEGPLCIKYLREVNQIRKTQKKPLLSAYNIAIL
jgi:hypothetical protein